MLGSKPSWDCILQTCLRKLWPVCIYFSYRRRVRDCWRTSRKQSWERQEERAVMGADRFDRIRTLVPSSLGHSAVLACRSPFPYRTQQVIRGLLFVRNVYLQDRHGHLSGRCTIIWDLLLNPQGNRMKAAFLWGREGGGEGIRKTIKWWRSPCAL